MLMEERILVRDIPSSFDDLFEKRASDVIDDMPDHGSMDGLSQS